MSEEKDSSVPNALYYAIAGEIVKDDKYLARLKADPRAQIKAAAEKHKVSVNDEQLSSATRSVKMFLEDKSDLDINASATSYFDKGPLIEVA